MKKQTLLTLAALLVGSLTMMAQTVVVTAPQTDAVYRLPFEKGVQVTATALSPVQMGLGHALNLVDFCAWQLSTTSSAEVVAPREGIIEKAGSNSLLLRHDDGLYTSLSGLESTSVAEGKKVARGEKIGEASEWNGKYLLRVESFYLTENPNYGTEGAVNSAAPTLRNYINPVFTTRGKCKVQLTDGGSYTVKARKWCWPWE